MSTSRGALRDAIKARFDASPALVAAAPGGLHYAVGRWAAGTAASAHSPHVTFRIVDDVPERTLHAEAAVGYMARVQFDAWSTDSDPDECETIVTLLADCYDRQTLTFTAHDYDTVAITLETTIGPMELDADPNVDGWRCTEDYLMQIYNAT